MRAGQVQVLRRAGAQVVARSCGRRPRRRCLPIEHRNHQRAIEVLVAALAQDADAAAGASRIAAPAARFFSGRRRPSVRLAKPSLKRSISSGWPGRALSGTPSASGAFLQALVVVADDLVEQLLVVGIERHRRRQRAHRRALDGAGRRRLRKDRPSAARPRAGTTRPCS